MVAISEYGSVFSGSTETKYLEWFNKHQLFKVDFLSWVKYQFTIVQQLMFLQLIMCLTVWWHRDCICTQYFSIFHFNKMHTNASSFDHLQKETFNSFCFQVMTCHHLLDDMPNT
jgi:hypothetical protein